MKKSTLIIISVPFGRNARLLLSSAIYHVLKKSYNILIISPFSNCSHFRAEFGGPNVYFLSISNSKFEKNRWPSRLFRWGQELRMKGYYFKFRKNKMKHLWKESSSLKLTKDGKYIKKSFKEKLRINIFGRLGQFRMCWKLIDKIMGRFFYDIEEIMKYKLKYENILMIQTANFGFQECFLGYFARNNSIKSLLVPYTTDQLSACGYLIGNYNYICVQGPIETEYAIQYHKISPEKIFPLGMLWFRNLETLKRGQIAKDNERNNKITNTILYAGCSPKYFPIISEFTAIDEILLAIKTGMLLNSKLIYRPMRKDNNEIEVIKDKYKNENLIEIQTPQVSCYGMEGYPSSEINPELIKYVNDIISIDVFVMSGITSMMLDALYFNKPVISNYTDPTLYIRERGEHFSLEEDVFGHCSAGMPVVFSIDDLIQKIKEALNNPSWHTKVRENILSNWDYQNQNYVTDFMNLIKELIH